METLLARRFATSERLDRIERAERDEAILRLE